MRKETSQISVCGGYGLFLSIVLLCMLVLNILECPFFSDDLLYYFVFETDDHGQWDTDNLRRVDSLSQLWWSQWNHYSIMNGRWVAHMMAQFKLAFVPPLLFKVANAIMFALMVHFAVRLTSVGKRTYLVSAVLFCFLLFVVIRGFSTAFLWDVGSFNYLWILTANLAFFVYLRHIKDEPVSMRHCMLSIFALFVGCNHEALALPVLAALALFFFKNRSVILHKALFPYLVFYVIGGIICLLTPTLYTRVSADSPTLSDRLFFGVVNFVFNVRVFWILVALLVCLWFNNRSFLKEELTRNVYAYIVVAVSFMIVFLVGTTSERSAFIADFLAILVLIELVSRLVYSRMSLRRLIVIGCCIVMSIVYILAVWVNYEKGKYYVYLDQQLKDPSVELVAVREPKKGESKLLDLLRSRYVNFDIHFSYYGVCFEKERFINALYHRQETNFLPEDVVLRIKADGHAFDGWGTDTKGDLFLRRIDDDAQVKGVVVRAATTHDMFEVDSLHFKTMKVCGGTYLAFPRPPGSKYHDIDSIIINNE